MTQISTGETYAMKVMAIKELKPNPNPNPNCKVMAIKELKNKGALPDPKPAIRRDPTATLPRANPDPTEGALGRVLEREKPVLEQLSHPFIVGLVGGYISKVPPSPAASQNPP